MITQPFRGISRSFFMFVLVGGLMLSSSVMTTVHADSAGADGESVHIDRAAQQLSSLSRAFKAVAKKVEPSVVSVIAKASPNAVQNQSGVQRFGPGMNQEELEDLFDLFRRRFDMPADPRMLPRPRQQPEDEEFRQYDVPRQIGAGSGWVWDDQGHIITNNHVIAEADEIEVRFSNGRTALARVVGRDEQTDIAVLRVERNGLTPAARATAPVDQGEIVFAFGSPFRYEFSMSQGIVSGKGRQVGILGPGGYENFIQTDAAINPGNSGGPLTNVRGEVVGMNTAIATRTGTFSGIGFAIPMDMITDVVGKIISNGRVVRGYLGAWIGDDAKLLQSFGVESGVLLHDVMQDGPAAQSGLKAGDIVLKIDGRAVGSAAELRRVVASITPDKKIPFLIVRDGKQQTIIVTIGELPGIAAAPTMDDDPAEDSDASILRKLGFEGLDTLTPAIAQRLGMPGVSGVLVTRVRPGSVAAAQGIQPRMVIEAVMGTPVNTPEAMVRELDRHDLTRGVRLKVRLDARRSTFMVVSLDEAVN